jgi:ketosteroid isomerase-like protein
MKILTLAMLLLPIPGIGQNTSTESSFRDILVRLTKDYFDAYNKCDVEKMMSFNSDDIEIYTDFAGTTFGQEAVRQQLNNFCSYTSASDKPTIFIEIINDIKIYKLLTKNDKVYGAVVQGTLNNYRIDKQSGLKEEVGTNEFFLILKFQNDKWLVSRDISFNTQIDKDKN